MNIFTFSITFIVFTSIGFSKTLKERKIDFNDDGIIDRVEYFLGKDLKKLKEDRNADQTFDLTIDYLKKDSVIKKVYEDNDFDGDFEIFKKLSSY